MHYFFTDASEQPSRIIEKGGKHKIYKELWINNQKKVVQFLPRRAIIPQELSTSSFNSLSSVKEWIQMLWRWIQHSSRPPFPSFLKNADFRFWVDPSDSNQVFVCNKEGSPLYQLQFSRKLGGYRVLKQGADLRQGTHPILFQKIERLADASHPVWKALTRFEDQKNILVWKTLKGEVDRIELFRFDLSFRKQGDALICLHPDYKGWILRKEDLNSLATKEVPGALVLSHPEQKERKKILLPKHQFREGVLSRSSSPIRQFLYMLFCWIKKRIPSSVHHDPFHFFHFDETTPHVPLLAFDSNPHTLAWTTPSSKKNEELLYVAQVCCHVGNWSRALEFIEQTKHTLSDQLSSEEEKAIEHILTHPFSTPESCGVKLHAALLSLPRLSPSKKQKREIFLIALYKKYLEYGHKIPHRFRLKKEQESLLFSLMYRHEPQWALSHFPLLCPTESHPHPVQQAQIKGRVQNKKTLPKATEINAIANAVLNSLKNQKKQEREAKKQNLRTRCFRRLFSLDKKQALFDQKSGRWLMHQFDTVYDTVRNRPLNDKEFLQKEALLLSVREGEKENPFFTQDEPVTPLLKEYLLWIIDLRRTRNVQSDAFPLFDLSFKEEELENRSPDADQNKQKTTQLFFENLHKLISSHFSEEDGTPLDTSPTKEQMHSLLPLLSEYLGPQFPSFLNAISESESDLFPTRHKNTTPVSISLPKIEPCGGALFEKKDVEELFQSVPALSKEIHHIPNLSLLEQETEPAILAEKEKILKEVQIALDRKKDQNIHVLKSEEDRKKCLEQLLKKQSDATQCEENKRQALLDFFSLNSSALHQLQKTAGFIPSTEVADILRACLQNDWASIEKALPLGKTKEEIFTLVLDYIDAASQKIRCHKALALLKEMDPAIGGVQEDASERLYQILTSERHYDPKEHPYLAAFEMYLGFTLRSNQLKTIVEMVHNPNAIKQAETGSGKTTVIQFLKALMIANGENLSTVVLPKDLFKENVAYIQENLGKLYERNTYSLIFSEETPLTLGNRSIFQDMHHHLIQTIQHRGVVATTRESIQALQKSFIKQVHRFNLTHQLDDKQRSHLIYSAKILELFQENSLFHIDEFDSLLSPKQRQDLGLSNGKMIHYPNFYREEALRIYRKLSQIENLGLKTNTQAERFAQYGPAAMEQVAKERVQEWEKEGIAHAHLLDYFFSRLDPAQEKAFLSEIQVTPDQQDRLAVIKDLFSTFIPLALQKKEDGKYKRSANGSDTVNCSTPQNPREGSRPKETLETICYTIQDYLYQGISSIKVQNVVRHFCQLADRELQPLCSDLKEDKDKSTSSPISIDQTQAARQFQKQFSRENAPFLLSSFSAKNNEQAIQELTQWIHHNEEKKWEFLEEQLSRISDYAAKISCTSANFVSMARSVGGASATTGNPLAYPEKIHHATVTEPGTVGEMILNLQSKVAHRNIETFSPEKPLSFLLKQVQENNVHSLVDGSIAFTGIDAKTAAEKILDHLPTTTPIQGVVFFDNNNVQRIMTRDKKIHNLNNVPISSHERSMVLLSAHARGADVQIGTNNHILVLANTSMPLEEILQTAGRSRVKNDITIGLPQGSKASTLDDLIALGILKGALAGSDDLVRAKLQEFDDIVRHDMLSHLIALTASISPGKEDEIAQLFQKYQNDSFRQFLVQDRQKEFKPDGSYEPGTYFAIHGAITRKDKSPKGVCKASIQELHDIAKNLDLHDATAKLLHWKILFEAHDLLSGELAKSNDVELLSTYSDPLGQLQKGLSLSTQKQALSRLRKLDEMLRQMPTFIEGKEAPELETSVDLDTEREAESEIEVDRQVDMHVTQEQTKKQPYYLDWVEDTYNTLSNTPRKFHLHSFKENLLSTYDPLIQSTENIHPLGRKTWADPVFHRTPHDRLQTPLDCIEFQFDPSNGQCTKIVVEDPLDAAKNGYYGRNGLHWAVTYSLRSNQFFRRLQLVEKDGKKQLIPIESIPKEWLIPLAPYIAQIRFENGEYQKSQYRDGQWEALEEWLSKQPVDRAEKYFVQEILKHRPDDLRNYQASDLQKFFTNSKEVQAFWPS